MCGLRNEGQEAGPDGILVWPGAGAARHELQDAAHEKLTVGGVLALSREGEGVEQVA